MTKNDPVDSGNGRRLEQLVPLDGANVLASENLNAYGGLRSDASVLVVLAAGKGTRFGSEPKCIQPVRGVPLARRSIEEFRRFHSSPVIGIVGYRHEDVADALGDDNVYVRTLDPAGGTALAAFEALSVPGLLDANPALVITMGDRVVPASIYRRLWETHLSGEKEADLTFLTAEYEPPKNRGKGRIVRDEAGRLVRIVEERDIPNEKESFVRRMLSELTEGNCPLYVVRAKTLHRYARNLTNANAQGQYYLTDIVSAIRRDGGEIRTVTTKVGEPEYDLLCSDVTHPTDLALLEGLLSAQGEFSTPLEQEVDAAARAIALDRPAVQTASIARQLEQLTDVGHGDMLEFQPDRPIGIGVSGGRLRLAFMHPDMARFFGPAWQMPIGAGSPEGEEQITMIVQGADDGRLHLLPIDPKYQESVNWLPTDDDAMYPGEEVTDLSAYEQFGTKMSETMLLKLGYFSDEELTRRREAGLPLPPTSRWVGSNMRRPFALVCNALASMRTLRGGNLAAEIKKRLGREGFRGLRLKLTGDIPQGGFSSSSAVTVAVKNAINALYDFGIPADLLVHLACQAEYGTGVRAGSLDQATEQKGRAGQGTLISSNPRDNYATIATYPVPSDRFQIIFPNTVDRDCEAWRWSGEAYAGAAGEGPGTLTTSEMRKMTGKAAEIAAILTRLPLDLDFFKPLEDDLASDGKLDIENRILIRDILRELPLLIGKQELRDRVHDNRDWFVLQLMGVEQLDREAAECKAEASLDALFTGWREPIIRRTTPDGTVVHEQGVPLRAMLAYLFCETVKNFHLVHHPEDWIESVALSQRGDRCVSIDVERLPDRESMMQDLSWEGDVAGPERMERWLERCEATPFDFNRGLEDDALSQDDPLSWRTIEGTNFFRGLALIDLAEAMLVRAFGKDAVAVRVNAAGQGDYFQVHVDVKKAEPNAVKQFLRAAFYRRFGLSPRPDFVQLHPGGGAAGVILPRYDALPLLVRKLKGIC
jgi:hypothetical protein